MERYLVGLDVGTSKVTAVVGEMPDGKGLDGAFAVVVSPGGKHIYIGSSDINAVTVFQRD